jgi:hypothetical protein
VEENVKPKRILVEFGPCASPPYKARKVFTSKVSSKSALSNSKVLAKYLAESIPKPPNSLLVAFMAISKAYSEIIEGDHFEDVNKTVVTYVPDVFKCPDGYMSSQIYKEVVKVPSWAVPLAILSALIFTIIINSYWPMLISMFHSLKRILAEMLGIAKTVEKIQDNQEHGVELLNILSTKQPSVSKSTTSSDPSSVSKKSDSPYCLWCWVVVCIFCGFVAALFIAAVFLSLIISLTEPVMEPQCEKIERQLSNGETSTSISILGQDEEGTTVIMPCDGIAVDEIGNEYQGDGAYKLSCDPPVTFNYVTSIRTWRADHCCTYPDWKYEKRNHGYSKTEGG